MSYALVEFVQAGSIAGAADRLFRTPRALEQARDLLQRTEALKSLTSSGAVARGLEGRAQAVENARGDLGEAQRAELGNQA